MLRAFGARAGARALARGRARAIGTSAAWETTAADTAQAQAGGIAGEDAARERERARERARASRDDANGGDARIGGMWMLDGGVGSAMVEMWMMAVPKRKVTPSRRKKRNQFKRLPFVESVVRCAGCGKVNLPHVRCCDVEREDARRGGRGDGDAP